jgi:hypothetical protein
MIVKIDSLDTIYFLLKKANEYEEDSQNEGSLRYFNYDCAGLKYPLSEIGLKFRKSIGKYSIISYISSKEEDIFLHGGRELSEKLSENGYIFLPKDKDIE